MKEKSHASIFHRGPLPEFDVPAQENQKASCNEWVESYVLGSWIVPVEMPQECKMSDRTLDNTTSVTRWLEFFFSIWPPTSIYMVFPNDIKNFQSAFSILPNAKLPKSFKILPKYFNVAKSGHTGYNIGSVSWF